MLALPYPYRTLHTPMIAYPTITSPPLYALVPYHNIPYPTPNYVTLYYSKLQLYIVLYPIIVLRYPYYSLLPLDLSIHAFYRPNYTILL